MLAVRASVILAWPLVALTLAAAPSQARTAPERGDSYQTVPAQQPASDGVLCSLAADSRGWQRSSGPATQTDPSDPSAGDADYPTGAAGTSNGELTASQTGEPGGAGGTSGSSLSPVTRASEPPAAAAFARVYVPVGQCRPASSLRERRLVHADLIQALRDGQ